MFIKELKIENFRGFKEETIIQFQNGINVLIGANNSGKTTILKSLELLFSNNSSKYLKTEDFNHNTTIEDLKTKSPKVIISATLVESKDEDRFSDDLITVSTWLTKIEKPYEAKITYEFALPEKDEKEYFDLINSINSNEINSYWNEIESTIIKKYTYKIFIGNPEYKNPVDHDSIKQFDFQFMNAIRDVERDLFSGKNTLLKEVIDFFIDYDIKINNIKKSEKSKQIKERKNLFSKEAQNLIDNLQSRMITGKKEMLKYVEETGANFDNSKPNFDGKITDTELYSALKLVVQNETGITLPATRNGLGYNNLIFISLLLAKMQKNSSKEYLGDNAKTFSILAFEEPEAHLHPNMQYKLLKFLDTNRSSHEVRQMFITTHSPNITAAVNLDSIVALSKINQNITISYPGKVFNSSEKDQKSKKYVERFLDVTKADMFFAKNLIFVEGLAEQILIPTFAEVENKSLIDSQVSIINLNGRYFNHFLKLFDTNNNKNAIPKKIACITDLDPVRKLNGSKEKWKICFPFMLNLDNEEYSYKKSSNELTTKFQDRDNSLIRVYTQSIGSTFEYELILENYSYVNFITESVINHDELATLMNSIKPNMNEEDLKELIGHIREGSFKDKINNYLKKDNITSAFEKARHIVAARYLKSIKKGEIAQELSYTIIENCLNHDKDRNQFKVPLYIREAIEWICR